MEVFCLKLPAKRLRTCACDAVPALISGKGKNL